ncbi:MAG: OsmC family protein [Candidatus Lokiarchaeota archaeon]|nr:OsmC family protein [Candidatus Lokiarchaeota archaeon]
MSEYQVELEWLTDPEIPYKRMARMGSTADGLPQVVCVTPADFEKGIPNHWTPEHLFVSSCVACYFTTFMRISEGSKLSLEALSVKGTGVLGDDKDGKRAMTRIDIYPEIVVKKAADAQKAMRIAEKVEESCLISNSMKSEIFIHPSARNA